MIEGRLITLCYRKLIDVNNTKAWDKLVFEDSFLEFKMQSQLYNQEKKYHTFGEIIQNVKGAENLHFLVSGAITNYINQLKQVIPDISNNLGKLFLKFENFRFEIINAHLTDISKYTICIYFYSETLVWHDTVAPYLLVSKANVESTNSVITEMVAIRPYLTISSLKK